MKKLFIIPVILLILALLATPVFANDPPDTNVDIGIGTPGDVDVDVDINAGGNVDVTIDGMDIRGEIDGLNSGLARAMENDGTGSINTHDWYRYWYKEMAVYVQIIANMDSSLGLLANAEAKLIAGQNLTEDELINVNVALSILDDTVDALSTETDTTVGELQKRDDVIWNQLMYGAEAHIAILDSQIQVQGSQLQEQSQKIGELYTELDSQKTALEISNANYLDLRNYTDYLQRQYLYYFWIVGGFIVLLLCLIIKNLAKNKIR